MSKLLKIILIPFLCASGSVLLHAQNSKLYMVEHGLSSSRIRTLYEDKDGFIWVAGENGLDRLIGDHIQKFLNQSDNPLSISNNDITDVFMDSKGSFWIGTGKGLNRYLAEKNEFERITLDETERSERGFSISSIVESPLSGKLFVSTSGHGLYVLNKNDASVDREQSSTLNRLIGNKYIGDLLIDNRKWLWFLTSDFGLWVIDLRTMKRIHPFEDAEMNNFIGVDKISCLKFDHKTSNVLIGSSSNGLLIYDASKGILRKPQTPNLQHINIQSLLVKKDGTILIGSENRGVWIFDRNTENVQSLVVANNNQVDLIHSKVHALLEDNVGNLWIGLYQKGLFLVPKSNSGFEYHVVTKDQSGKNCACVSAFTIDLTGNLWISTDGGGVFQAPGRNWDLLHEKGEGLTCNSMMDMAVDMQGTMWTGSYGHGLFCQQGGVFTQPDFVSQLTDNKVMCLEYDALRNFLYVGTNGGGLDIVDLSAKKIRHVHAPINKWIRTIHVDRTGRLWIGTAEGTTYYDVDRGSVLNADIGIATYHPSNCFEEIGNMLYIGTNGGLIEYDMRKNKNTVIDLGTSLGSKNIMSMTFGKDQSLWFTTPKNLSRLNLKTKHIRTYSSFDGFLIGEFRYGSVLKDTSGYLLFGGDNGIIQVDPIQVNRQQYQMRPIFFTALNVNNNFVDYNGESKNRNRLDASLLEAKKLNLKYKENSFSLYFSAQEYASPQKVNYSYRLTGYENLWHHTDASNALATYASLPAGRYTFEVKGYFNEESNNFTTRSIRITISHPWYNSILARFFYFVLLFVLLYFTSLFYKNKQVQRRKLVMAQYNEQVKEDKLRLFTSIAHEIRTPLTLIVSPLKKLMNTVGDNETSEMYSLMYRNSMKILKTINQLLDVRKLDNGQLKLHFEEVDLIGLIKGIMLSFKNMATVKQISFTMESRESDYLNTWLDIAHFDKIVYNILSNAFKFTPIAGKILIRIHCINNPNKVQYPTMSELAEIRIFNTGSSIDEEDLIHIFERFYQGHKTSEYSGSGIGLHLTHELVLLHHGQIEAHNVAEDGVEFIVRIPLGNAHLSESELIPQKTDQESLQSDDNDMEIAPEKDYIESISAEDETDEKEPHSKHTILVVDDDEDFCHYLKKELVDYNILTSNSGNQAWKQLLSVHPDVVVTDYMMPDGDGLELCQRIKNNPETDSTPVIILTSEHSEVLQMQSMQLHADRFLTKPFNILLLKGAIGQALRVREKIRNKVHRTEMGYNYNSVAMDSADNKLVKKVIEYIKEHLEDSDMSVEELSREVGFSRVHLNRKLKEILGLSPSNLIKSIRLKQAAFLLVNNKVNISEVAYKVGFSSHSYFSYNFHDFFGMSPKEFVIYYTENPDEESIRKLLE
jgi:signal transduction histidine kinase/ligand-binding sensor domain-containing protein/DNA-binding response OmpR family regulator